MGHRQTITGTRAVKWLRIQLRQVRVMVPRLPPARLLRLADVQRDHLAGPQIKGHEVAAAR